ncbi:hypothetical protein RDI58_026060 [Solanum bulbocastanum]|uniref:Uncharacterized protein n=1 Tax=Solanum bulbocastanum TaxID=147425 RepID=A0AAN8Y0S7_SOLBU
MAENSKKMHIAVFPWLAFGHMIPYLELSKLIAQKGHKISFISTPRNIDRLPILPPNLPLFKFCQTSDAPRGKVTGKCRSYHRCTL